MDKICDNLPLNLINNLLWGKILIVLLAFAGLYFSFSTRFYQIRKLPYIIRNTIGSIFKIRNSDCGISPFKAVCTALGGTIGVGNTIGVAAAICDGGPGAVFWMWISAILGMIVKYAEIYLSVLFKEPVSSFGGPMYYMKLLSPSGRLSNAFCIACILTSFGMGNLAQSKALADAASSTFHISKNIASVIISAAVLVIIGGGVKRIIEFSSSLVPIMSVLYITMCLGIIIINRGRIGYAFTSVIKGAFGLDAIVGGIKGSVIAKSIRFGFSRGIFTNEAGLGSAPIVHSSSDESVPEKQAVWGIFEVFVDTILVCSLTAAVILTSNTYYVAYTASERLTFNCFNEAYGAWGGYILNISMIMFALASIICWSYYGKCALQYMTPSKGLQIAYIIAFALTSYFGCFANQSYVWEISDLFNGIMLLLNAVSIIILAKFVKAEGK